MPFARARALMFLPSAVLALISGDRTAVPLDLSLDRVVVQPEALVDTASGCKPIVFRPGFALTELGVTGHGPSPVTRFTAQSVNQDVANDNLTASRRRTFEVQDGGRIEIDLDGPDGADLDLNLYRDANGDGLPAAGERVAMSGSSGSDENIRYENPVDGTYLVTVHGFKVPDGTATFDFDLFALQGRHVTARGLPTGGVAAGETVTFEVCYELPPDAPSGRYEAEFGFGPLKVPGLLKVPVRVTMP